VVGRVDNLVLILITLLFFCPFQPGEFELTGAKEKQGGVTENDTPLAGTG
jgi:hypothetical protein